MKHLLSNKVEVFLVTGVWLIVGGLVVASYFTATTPTARFLSVLVLVLVLIAVGWYVWNAIQISRGQNTLREMQEQIEVRSKQLELYEQINGKMEEVHEYIETHKQT